MSDEKLNEAGEGICKRGDAMLAYLNAHKEVVELNRAIYEASRGEEEYMKRAAECRRIASVNTPKLVEAIENLKAAAAAL